MNSILCRLCANSTNQQIEIFSPEGINLELAHKINQYLFIEINISDNLPLQCCSQCITMILTWHEFVLISSQVDINFRKNMSLKEMLTPASNETNDMVVSTMNNEVNATNKNTATLNPEKEATENRTDCLQDHTTNEYSELTSCDIKNECKIEIEFDDIIENQKKFECSLCRMLYTSQSLLNEHIKIDHPATVDLNIVIRKAKRSKVKFKYSPKHMVKQPIANIDPAIINKAEILINDKIFYKCEECGKCLHSIYTYICHRRIHTGERPFVCDLCGKQFRVSQGLVIHLKGTHQKIKRFKCDLCDRHFTTKRNVDDHRRVHTNERPYVCETCGKAFKQKASLYTHNLSHSTEFPYECTYCSLKFRTKQLLLRHNLRHTGEKPYPCDTCQKRFPLKNALNRHKLIHSVEKSFSCKICKQMFGRKQYLKNHLKMKHQITNLSGFIN